MTLIRRAILALALIAGFGPALAQAPTPVPALPDTERRTSYSITASTCVCSVGFQLYGDGVDYANWLEVFIDGVRYDYNDASHGWTITVPTQTLATRARPITDAILTFNAVQTGTVQIVGSRRPRRASQFSEGGVSARNLNQVITDIVSTQREFWDKTNDVTGRTLTSQPGVTLGRLPLPAVCPNGFLGFDATGANPVCRSSSGPGNVTLPVVDGHVAVFDGALGLLKDGGHALSGLNVSIMDYASTYGCIPGNYTTTCQAAFNAAIVDMYARSAGDPLSFSGTIRIPASVGCFRITGPITMLQGISLVGEGGLGSCILADDTDALQYGFTAQYGQPQVSNIFLFGCKWNGSTCSAPTAARTAIKVTPKRPFPNNAGTDYSLDRMLGLALQNLLIWNFDTAIDVTSVGNLWVTNSYFQRVNNCAKLNGLTFGARFNGFQCTFDGGDGLGSRGDAITTNGFAYATPTVATYGPEAIEVNNSDILDFTNGIRLNLGNVATVTNSTLQGTVSGVRFKDWGKGLFVKNNYILTTGASAQAGVFGEGTVVDSSVRANQVVSITDNVLESIGSGAANNGIQINEAGLFGSHNVNMVRNDFTGFTGRDIYVFGPNQITTEGNTARSTGTVASIEYTSAVTFINFITRNVAAVSIVNNGADLTSGAVRKCDNIVAGVKEACSWGVTINDTQTLANKTLTTPIINGIPSGTGVVSINTPSTLVFRDASGNFSAGTITATLNGSATSTTSATNATNSAITNDTTTNATMFPAWVTANTGNLPLKVTSTKLTFNPSTGALSSTSFTGAGTGLTGTAASLTAGTASAVALAGITGLGTGLPAALAINVGTAGSPVINGGALGSPSSVGTMPAFLLGGTVNGGGNSINNTLIGTVTPQPGAFTTVTGSTSVTSPIHASASSLTFQANTSTVAGAIDTTGHWSLGTQAPIASNQPLLDLNLSGSAVANPTAGTPIIRLVAPSGNTTDLTMQGYGAGGITYSGYAAGGTAGTPAALTSGTIINSLRGVHWDGAAWGNAGGATVLVSMRASQLAAVGAHGTEVAIGTTPNGTTTRADAIVVQNSGCLSIGAAAIAADCGIGSVSASGFVASKAPVTSASGTSSTVGATDSDYIVNASGTYTLTLPGPGVVGTTNNTGRELHLKVITAQIVNSASSNVVPLAGGAAGTAILTATAGKWARLKSDGTTRIIMAAN